MPPRNRCMAARPATEKSLRAGRRSPNVTDMKRLLFVLAAGWFATPVPAAEDNFTKALRPDDYAAAGLGKLSAEERARLDALVRDYKSGALEAAKREAAAAAQARMAAEARATKAEAEAAAKATAAATAKKAEPGPSLLERTKVLLTPGTKIEYSTLESRIAGEFRGWGPKTIFKLENGQRWQVIDNDSYVTKPSPSPAVKITPGALGAFWMSIEGVNPRVKVQSLDAK